MGVCGGGEISTLVCVCTGQKSHGFSVCVWSRERKRERRQESKSGISARCTAVVGGCRGVLIDVGVDVNEVRRLRA